MCIRDRFGSLSLRQSTTNETAKPCKLNICGDVYKRQILDSPILRIYSAVLRLCASLDAMLQLSLIHIYLVE